MGCIIPYKGYLIHLFDFYNPERMARNRDQALRRLHSRQFKGRAHSETTILTTHCSVRQTSSLPDIANALYTKKDRFMPLEDTNGIQQDCNLFGNVESGPEVRSTRVNQTCQMVIETSNVNHECQDTVKAQDFDYVVVIDFEATCDKDMNGLKPQEIIEFPAVIVDCRRLTLQDSFQTYVKPVHHPILTDFCRNLTGINQDQVLVSFDGLFEVFYLFIYCVFPLFISCDYRWTRAFLWLKLFIGMTNGWRIME